MLFSCIVTWDYILMKKMKLFALVISHRDLLYGGFLLMCHISSDCTVNNCIDDLLP